MGLGDILKQASSTGPILQAYNRYLMDRSRGAFDEEDAHADGRVHPSSVGGCPVAACISSLGLGKGFGGVCSDPKSERIFGIGTAIHRMLQADFIEAGLVETMPDGKPAIEVQLSVPELNLGGHVDVVFKPGTANLAVGEIKSKRSTGMPKLQGPEPSHEFQAACYWLGIPRAFPHIAPELMKTRDTIFLYYGKDDSEIKEFLYRPSDGKMEETKKRIAVINGLMQDFVKTGAVPGPCYDDPSKPPCKWCRLSRVCHGSFDRKDFLEHTAKLRKEGSYAKPQAIQQGQATAEPATGKRVPPVRRPPVRR